MKRSKLYAVLAALALACDGFAAWADSDGWVLFTKADIHQDPVPILRVNEFGKIFQQSYNFTDGDFLLTNWAHGLIGYDKTLNSTCAFQITEDGGHTSPVSCSNSFDALTSVTKLVAFGEFIFGYDGGNKGLIVQYAAAPPGEYPIGVTTETLNLSRWTNIFATRNYIFFYNKSSGIYAVGTISDTGQFVQYDNGMIAAGYGLFAKVGDTVVGYNATNGRYEVDAINLQAGTGAFSVKLARQSKGTFGTGYSTVAAIGNTLVWHSKATGATLVGYLDRSPATVGKWVRTLEYTSAAGYGYEVAAGNCIILYNTTTGVAVATTVSSAGALVSTDSVTVGAGYTNIGVTTR